MAEALTLTEARRRLSAFLDDVRDGERYVITRRGQPVAALVSIENLRQIEDAEPSGRRPGGALALAGLWATCQMPRSTLLLTTSADRASDAALNQNADRMMTSVTAVGQGIEVAFADGRAGLIPFTAIPEIAGLAALASIELPNPYEIVLRDIHGETLELPWDFARHYCDPSYRARIEAKEREDT